MLVRRLPIVVDQKRLSQSKGPVALGPSVVHMKPFDRETLHIKLQLVGVA